MDARSFLWTPWLLFCSLLLTLSTQGQDSLDRDTSQTVRVFRFDLNEEIAPPAWRLVQKVFEEADSAEADLVFMQMNTYGGLVDMADSIRTRILRSPVPVYVLIQNNAASAGALISLACDSIYMQSGSTIGAATVVGQDGVPVADKYQSYMRKKMRATAEANGRDPDIAEAMVDPDKVVPGVSDSGKVVTFTTSEALEYGFCEAEVNTMEEALAHAGITNYVVITHEPTTLDAFIGWLVSPAISGLLILIIIGGIYFELQTPGVGFPILASLVAAVFYFAPLYLEGLAENWEIALFFVGVILVALEIFVIPGFGVAGISGIVAMVLGLVLSLIQNVAFDFTLVNTDEVLQAFLVVLLSSTIAIGGSVALGARLLTSQLFSRLVLDTVQTRDEGFVSTGDASPSLVGKAGSAVTVLRPSGRVEIEGEQYDATSELGFIEAGAAVRVVRSETTSLYVVEA